MEGLQEEMGVSRRKWGLMGEMEVSRRKSELVGERGMYTNCGSYTLSWGLVGVGGGLKG